MRTDSKHPIINCIIQNQSFRVVNCMFTKTAIKHFHADEPKWRHTDLSIEENQRYL